MTEIEMKKLSRADLLQMLIDQSEELQALQEKLEIAEAALQQRELIMNSAGSIAEASLQLNGIFEAAQASCQQYIDSVNLLCKNQEEACARREAECQETIELQLAEAKVRCSSMESETKANCAEMVAKAKIESQAYWKEVSQRLDAYYKEHIGLRDLLTVLSLKEEQE